MIKLSMSHTKVRNKSFPIEITLQMFKSIICGRCTKKSSSMDSSFHEEDDEQEDHHQWTPLSTPKKSSSNSSTPRKSFSNSSTPKKSYSNTPINPYSNRGLDKFATVLAELEEKRQKIYEQVSPKDIHVVQFTYSITQDCWVPIVVKVKDDKQEKPELLVHGGNDTKENQKSETLEEKKSSSASIEMFKEQPPKPSSENIQKKKKKAGILDMGKWRRPSSYWPLMLIAFILFCLVIFGRSFAIIFTAMFWYLKPIVKREDHEILMKSLSMKKKKESLRKKKMMINGDGYSYHKSKNLELGSSLQR